MSVSIEQTITNVTVTYNPITVTVALPVLQANGGAGVTTFNNRSGTVDPETDDYTADQITETVTNEFITPALKAQITTNQTNITNKQDGLSGLPVTSVAVAADDKVLIQDTSDSNNLKTVTTQSIANLASPAGLEFEIQYSDGAGNFASSASIKTDVNGALHVQDATVTTRGFIYLGTGTASYIFRNGNNLVFGIGSTDTVNIQTGLRLVLPSGGQFGWGATTVYSTKDIGLARLTDGIMKVTDGDGGYGRIACHNVRNSYTSKTANYNILVTDHTVELTANNATFTLPAGEANIINQPFVLINSGNDTLTVNVSGGGNINGSVTIQLSIKYIARTLIWNGTEYRVI